MNMNNKIDSKDNEQVINQEEDLLKYFSEEELEESANELSYIEKHIDEYKENNNFETLKKNIANN